MKNKSCWKKGMRNHYNHKDGIANITIQKQNKKDGRPKRYEVSVNKFKPSSSISAEASYFSNKSTALKYAKLYMRRHC